MKRGNWKSRKAKNQDVHRNPRGDYPRGVGSGVRVSMPNPKMSVAAVIATVASALFRRNKRGS